MRWQRIRVFHAYDILAWWQKELEHLQIWQWSNFLGYFGLVSIRQWSEPKWLSGQNMLKYNCAINTSALVSIEWTIIFRASANICMYRDSSLQSRPAIMNFPIFIPCVLIVSYMVKIMLSRRWMALSIDINVGNMTNDRVSIGTPSGVSKWFTKWWIFLLVSTFYTILIVVLCHFVYSITDGRYWFKLIVCISLV